MTGIGLVTGLTALVNPRSLAVGIGFILATIVSSASTKSWRKMPKLMAVFSCGFLVPLVAAGFWAYVQGWLFDMLDAVVTYNRLYLETGEGAVRLAGRLLTAILRGEPFLILFALAILGVGVGMLSSRTGLGSDDTNIQANMLLRWTSISILIDLVLLLNSKWFYTHYFIAALPSLTLGACHYVSHCLSLRNKHQRYSILIPILLLILLMSARQTLVSGLDILRLRFLYSNRTANCTEEQVVAYVKAHTTSSDTILVWGAESSIYVLSGRRSPTRYFYTYPLLMQEYDNEQRVSELLNDLYHSQPKLLIDTSSVNSAVPPLKPGSDQSYRSGFDADKAYTWDGFDPIRSYVFKHYEWVSSLCSFQIYQSKVAAGAP